MPYVNKFQAESEVKCKKFKISKKKKKRREEKEENKYWLIVDLRLRNFKQKA